MQVNDIFATPDSMDALMDYLKSLNDDVESYRIRQSHGEK